MRDQYLVFGQPLIEEDEICEVVDSLRSAWLGTGPKVAAFEKQVAAYKDIPHAVAVNSCTAGLHLACLATGLGPGDEVIAPAMTFCATINAIIHAGATPVPADVDPVTGNLDPGDVVRRITPRTKALMPVHFAGFPCDMDALQQIADRHGLKIIEDCAHAIETEYRGRKAGTIGECGVLSFYSTKNIVTGEGGMVLTRDGAMADRIKRLALHGMSQDAWKRFSDDGYKHYDVAEIGFKYNMMDLQAALGMHQIRRVESYWKRRLEIWQTYNRELAGLPLLLPKLPGPESRHGLHLYAVRVDGKSTTLTRDALLTGLHQQRIGTGVHYRAIPVHSAYRESFGWKPADYPHAMAIGDTTLSLPLSAKLTDGDVADVVAAVRSVFAGQGKRGTTS